MLWKIICKKESEKVPFFMHRKRIKAHNILVRKTDIKEEMKMSDMRREATGTSGIDCAAHECKYNTDSKCYAGKINVTGNHANRSEETACATFQK